MTIQEWRKNDALRVALREALAQPVMEHALSVLSDMHPVKRLALTSDDRLTKNGVSLAGLAAGYEGCLLNLKALAERPADMPEIPEPTYGIESERDLTE